MDSVRSRSHRVTMYLPTYLHFVIRRLPLLSLSTCQQASLPSPSAFRGPSHFTLRSLLTQSLPSQFSKATRTFHNSHAVHRLFTPFRIRRRVSAHNSFGLFTIKVTQQINDLALEPLVSTPLHPYVSASLHDSVLWTNRLCWTCRPRSAT